MKDCSHLIFITDLDGSLLNASKEITPKVWDAMQQFRSQGGKVTIATGRPLDTARPFIEKVNPDVPVILYNGATIYDVKSKENYFQIGLPQEAVAYTKEILKQFPTVGAEVLRSDGVYVVKNEIYEQKHVEICKITPFYTDCDHVSHSENLPWLKVVFAASPEDCEKVMEYMKQHSLEGAYFVKSATILLELLPNAVSKGQALKRFRSLPQAKDCAFIALGDYDNDIDMLEEAEYSFCPDNAQPSVKACVQTVLKESCDEDAAAKLLQLIMQ